MRLCKLAEDIATKRTEQHKSTKLIRTIQSELDAQNLQIDTSIAFDEDLRNDTQRKAKKLHMMSESSYQELLGRLIEAQDKQTELQISIDHLHHCLSIRKLELRLRIAQTESLEF